MVVGGTIGSLSRTRSLFADSFGQPAVSVGFVNLRRIVYKRTKAIFVRERDGRQPETTHNTRKN